MTEYVLKIEHEGWIELVLNQPETRNAITGPLGEQLADSIQAVDADSTTRLLMLRGAEGAFCSGLNLKEFNRISNRLGVGPIPRYMSVASQLS
ncbi:MAG: enoyl-CoA hydratase/isomerase family protein [Pseudomonadales bacterium]|nr:enoyl-CoA hydratase/isomerase family protein [Pseudomonadales bacterium]